MFMFQRDRMQQTWTLLLLLGVVATSTCSAFTVPRSPVVASTDTSAGMNMNMNMHSNSNMNMIKRSQRQQRRPSLSSLNLSFEVNGSVATNDGKPTSAGTSATSTSAASTTTDRDTVLMPRIQAQFVRAGMILFILSMCLALPVTLAPQYAAYKLGLIGKTRKERLALSTGQFCARWFVRIIPFCKLETIVSERNENDKEDSWNEPKPAVWVCNHTSMLDVFLLMAADRKLRGRHKRPIKIVYWKQLEDNPVTKLLFRQAGFIPIQMAANEPGQANDYDVGSFKRLLKDTKQAFREGFDIGILPEGQLNPTPDQGLQPVFSGAHTLARLSKRPVQMLALHGAHQLWHPTKGMHVTGRHVRVRSYGTGRPFSSAQEFVKTFEQVVGHFGMTGNDLKEPELNEWLTGKAWEKVQAASCE
jgi:1-acyl-sn-glycerol-3-phosphate acyltransferase